MWTEIMTRFRSYKGNDPHAKRQVKTFMDNKGKRITITYAGIRTNLRAAVQILGKGQLSFGPTEMGAHSLCSGASMAMYLTWVSPLKIMIIGIWWSDASLLYIRKQVSQFTTKVSDKMLQNKEFFTVLDFGRTIQEAKNGAFPRSLSNPDIDKEKGLPRSLDTWKSVSIGRQNLHW